MASRDDVMRSDRLKQVMMEIDPTFDEGNFGFSKFSRFLSEAASGNLVRLRKLENGQYEVLPSPADGKASARGRELPGRDPKPEAGSAPRRRTEGERGEGRRRGTLQEFRGRKRGAPTRSPGGRSGGGPAGESEPGRRPPPGRVRLLRRGPRGLGTENDGGLSGIRT